MSLVRILAGGFEGEFLLLLGILYKSRWEPKEGSLKNFIHTFRNKMKI
jgi:hypothetical protein